MEEILAPSSVSISELKANPIAVLKASGNQPVAILNRNKPIAYMLTARAWEQIYNMLEDQEILAIVEARMADKNRPVRVSLDKL